LISLHDQKSGRTKLQIRISTNTTNTKGQYRKI